MKTVKLILLLFALVGTYAHPAHGQEHNHPAADAAIHDQFYSTWRRPDVPKEMCCSKEDCYPTKMKMVGGTWFAQKRDLDGTYHDEELSESWIVVPEEKFEHNVKPEVALREPRDSPDSRNHACIRQVGTTWYVFCAVLGAGT